MHAALEPKAIPGIGIVIPRVDDPLKFRVFVNLRVAVVEAPFAVESSSSEALSWAAVFWHNGAKNCAELHWQV